MELVVAQIWVFLALCAAIGLAAGWLAARSDCNRHVTAPEKLFLGVFILCLATAACLSLFKILKGEAALWLDIFLIHAVSYSAGTLAGILAHVFLRKSTPAASTLAQERPGSFEMLHSVVASEGDNLKRINGIGKGFEKRLKAMGIKTYAQLAALTLEEAEGISAKMDAPGRILSEKWVEQADALVKKSLPQVK